MKGKFIAFAGMMGVGKSTLARALAQELQAKVYIEPEADHWPIPANEPWENHVFDLEIWVRNTNLKHFKLARADADAGLTAISDGTFFLINRELINAKSCEYYFKYLTHQQNEKLLQIAADDWHTAPKPDVLIMADTAKSTWLAFLHKRGRNMDGNTEMINNYEGIQELIANTANQYAKENNIQMIKFKNQNTTPEDNIKKLLQLI